MHSSCFIQFQMPRKSRKIEKEPEEEEIIEPPQDDDAHDDVGDGDDGSDSDDAPVEETIDSARKEAFAVMKEQTQAVIK